MRLARLQRERKLRRCRFYFLLYNQKDQVVDYFVNVMKSYLSEWFIFIYCRVILQKMEWSNNKPYPFVLIL